MGGIIPERPTTACPAAPQNGNTQRQLIVNGEVLGRYGTYLNPDKPSDSAGNPNFVTGANFNFGYTKISGSYPATQPGTRTVTAGETLKSIAKLVYGDSSLWYLVADANGLSSDRDLRVGQTLTVPNRVSDAKNNASTFKPYNPGAVIGDTTPNLPNPPAQASGGGGGGCGGLGAIIMVVVAVAVTVATNGAATAFFGGNAILGGAAAAAMGAVASQVVGNALGIVDGFDWKGVALAAVSGGVGAGMSTLAGGSSVLSGSGMGATIARAVIGNAVTQGIAVVTGLQDKFSWTSVAASAVGAGVGHGVNQVLGLTDAAGKATSTYSGVDKIVRAATSGFVSGMAATLARGGKVEVTQIATDVFGNALGNSLGEEMVANAEFDRISAQFDAMEDAGRKGLGFRTDMNGNVSELPGQLAGKSVAEQLMGDGAERIRGMQAYGPVVLMASAGGYLNDGVVSDAGGDGGPAAADDEFDLDDLRAQFGPDAITGPDPAPEQPSARISEPGRAKPGKSTGWMPDRPELGSASDYQKRADEQKRYAEQMRQYAAEAQTSGDARMAAEYRRMEAGYLNAAGLDQARASTIQTQTRPMWEGLSYRSPSDLGGYRDPTLARADRVAGIGVSQGRGILPDYQSFGVGAHTVTGTVSTNFYDGTIAYGGSVVVTTKDPGFKPTPSYSVGWIFGVNEAKGVTNFITGSGTQFGVAIPTPWKVNPTIVINHSYGGDWALELGIAPRTSSVIIYQPYGYSKEAGK